MTEQYEIRTSHGAPVFAFDNRTRAEQEREKAQRRFGGKLELWRVSKVEERVA